MFKSVVVFICGALIGGLVVWKLPVLGKTQTAEKPKVDLNALNDDVTRLKNITPNLSHVMADVAFQYSNLWFAGQNKNWPLATFYFNETRGRIKWMLRINPMPKTPNGEVVNAQGIYDAIDADAMAKLKQAIDDKNSANFATTYKAMLEGCYSCHKSAGRPYLRPMIPTTPPQSIINYHPDANWP
jgi:hypothetical protein